MAKSYPQQHPRESAVLAQVNKHRRNHERRPLKPSSLLRLAARAHAKDMAKRGYFSHDTKGGASWDVRIKKAMAHAKFSDIKRITHTLGENIAYGQDTCTEVVQAWINSPEHNRNLLDPNFTHMALGLAVVDGTEYWVQDFGG